MSEENKEYTEELDNEEVIIELTEQETKGIVGGASAFNTGSKISFSCMIPSFPCLNDLARGDNITVEFANGARAKNNGSRVIDGYERLLKQGKTRTGSYRMNVGFYDGNRIIVYIWVTSGVIYLTNDITPRYVTTSYTSRIGRRVNVNRKLLTRMYG